MGPPRTAAEPLDSRLAPVLVSPVRPRIWCECSDRERPHDRRTRSAAAPQEGEHDGGQLQRQSGRRRRRALAARAPRRCEHPGARGRPRRLRRQRLLIVGKQRRHRPRGHPQAGRQLPPGRHRRRREGHHRRPDHHHQARPGPARCRAGRRSLTYDENYKLGTDGLAEEVTQDKPDQWTIELQERDRVPQRQDALGRRRRLLAAAHPEPEGGPLRRRRARVDRPEEHQEDGQPARCGCR